jgi:phosphate transport system ATP-binding protein
MKVEELMTELAKKYTIIIVTHSMEQARRVSDMSAFLMIDSLDDDDGGKSKTGKLVEYAPTSEMFSNPQDKRTEDYITGRYG